MKINIVLAFLRTLSIKQEHIITAHIPQIFKKKNFQ